MKYGMFAYVMRYRKLKGKSVLKIKLMLTMLLCIYSAWIDFEEKPIKTTASLDAYKEQVTEIRSQAQ